MNVCVFSGRLVKDAETRYTTSGTAVSNFTIAVDTGFGEYKRTDFIDCVLWKREKLAEHLKKGKAIIVSGEYNSRKWEDKEGNKRVNIEIICRDVDFQQGDSAGGQKPEHHQPAPQNTTPAFNPDDDLPF